MNNSKYQKSVHHRTDKWSNIVEKPKENKQKQNEKFVNNPFKEFFKEFKIDVEGNK